MSVIRMFLVNGRIVCVVATLTLEQVFVPRRDFRRIGLMERTTISMEVTDFLTGRPIASYHVTSQDLIGSAEATVVFRDVEPVGMMFSDEGVMIHLIETVAMIDVFGLVHVFTLRHNIDPMEIMLGTCPFCGEHHAEEDDEDDPELARAIALL